MMRSHRAAALGRLSGFTGLVMVVLATVLPAGARALKNGNPCPPYWTEAAAPVARFSFTPSAPATQVSVAFDAGASTSGTAYKWTYVSGDQACETNLAAQPDPISLYKWNFGDGTTATSAGPTASHMYAAAGSYTVSVTVQEQNGRTLGTTTTYFTNTATQTLTISDRPPVASFTGPATVSTGQVANFDALGSSDPDGTIASYHWAFGDGQTLDTKHPVTAHIYTTAGTETVTLTVTDNSGTTNSAHQTVVVTASGGGGTGGGGTGGGNGGGNGGGGNSGGGHPHCVVPKLIGRTLHQARTLLAARHCVLGKVRRRHHVRKRNRGRVVAQSVRAGRKLRAGSHVAITVGRR